MTTTIAFTGRSQSGKNTCCNFIIGSSMVNLGVVRGGFRINDSGQLVISDLFGDTRHEGIFDITNPSKSVKKFNDKYLDKHIRLYAFADPIKRKIGMEILGLPYEAVYGTKEQKAAPTTILWENMAGVISPAKFASLIHNEKIKPEMLGLFVHEPGPMSGREVLMYIGTDIFRRMYSKVWVDATLRQIEEDNPEIALICDMRFPQEVFGVKETGGLSIRLTRVPCPENDHESETALNKDKFDWENFDFILDNEEMSIADQNIAVHAIVDSIFSPVGDNDTN